MTAGNLDEDNLDEAQVLHEGRRRKDLVGETVGDCKITDYLGEGGMGEVYRAFHETLRRPVAVKFLPSRDPEWKARFRQEAQLASAIRTSWEPRILAKTKITATT